MSRFLSLLCCFTSSLPEMLDPLCWNDWNWEKWHSTVFQVLSCTAYRVKLDLSWGRTVFCSCTCVKEELTQYKNPRPNLGLLQIAWAIWRFPDHQSDLQIAVTICDMGSMELEEHYKVIEAFCSEWTSDPVPDSAKRCMISQAKGKETVHAYIVHAVGSKRWRGDSKIPSLHWERKVSLPYDYMHASNTIILRLDLKDELLCRWPGILRLPR